MEKESHLLLNPIYYLFIIIDWLVEKMVEFLGPITEQGKAKPTQIIFSTQFKISPTVVVIVAEALNIMSGGSNLCVFFVQILFFLLNFGKL